MRLTHAQWLAFQELGGSQWLRNHIDKLAMAGVAKRERNRRVRAAHAAGQATADICNTFGIDRTTLWRIVT